MSNSIYGGFDYFVGSDGVTALTNGNYVVLSSNFLNIGAVTWGNGVSGTAGPVNISNSLLGSSADDHVGSAGVTALTNGNYVVRSPLWGPTNLGAVTWGNGTTGIIGSVSTANSLYGGFANDRIGEGGLTALTNGNLPASSPSADSGTAADVGAVTWGNGAGGITGPVNLLNSLVGFFATDSVGSSGVTALTNGNYVVSSFLWGPTDIGAVTWGNGSIGTSGPVTMLNSLHGTTDSDRVGLGGFESVTPLTNGNYVVSSKGWDNGPIANVGAGTWGNDAIGISAPVSTVNSLYGSNAGDYVGFGGVTALTNGNFVAMSPYWKNDSHAGTGAATWGNGTIGITGPVSVDNSLYGTSDGDLVGGSDLFSTYGVTAFADGNYAVSSPNWDNGATVNAGAVTWRSGTSSSGEAVSVTNSAVGTPPGQVGRAAASPSASGAYVIPTYQNRVLLMTV